MSKEMMTIKQVQEILQVSRGKVYKFINDTENPLKVIYLGDRTPRIREDDFYKWITKQEELNQ